MLRYALKRFLGALPTLFALMTAAFFMMRLAPGGPLDQERRVPAEVEGNLNRVYHLDEPLVQQYGRYLVNIVRGDFGPSFQYKDFTVTELIAGGFPVSLRLGGCATSSWRRSFRSFSASISRCCRSAAGAAAISSTPCCR